MPTPTGKILLELAATHLGEQYVLGTGGRPVPKNNPNWHGPWDCAEFVSWCVFQEAGILYGCRDDHGDPARADAYTGHWARDARNLGRIITVEEAARTPGAAVLRPPTADRGGHIVISDGFGGTVEAMSARRGVTRDTLSGRRWEMGILVPGINYFPKRAMPELRPAGRTFQFQKPPMHPLKDEAIRRIQQLLKEKGYDPEIDGTFGPKTFEAVLQFQQAANLVPDGEIGPETASALLLT